ncbi:MAG: cupin domain-containing protein [Halolamina sp.]
MEHVSVDDVETQGDGGNPSRRVLSTALATTDFAINHYRLDPGDRFSGGLHTHLDQEEAFYVIAGTATFQTRSEPLGETETIEVGPGEAVRFAPGEYQTGANEGDRPVEALAFGAPRASSEVRVPGPCGDCGAEVLKLDFGRGQNSMVCLNCGTETEVNV